MLKSENIYPIIDGVFNEVIDSILNNNKDFKENTEDKKNLKIKVERMWNTTIRSRVR